MNDTLESFLTYREYAPLGLPPFERTKSHLRRDKTDYMTSKVMLYFNYEEAIYWIEFSALIPWQNALDLRA